MACKSFFKWMEVDECADTPPLVLSTVIPAHSKCHRSVTAIRLKPSLMIRAKSQRFSSQSGFEKLDVKYRLMWT